MSEDKRNDRIDEDIAALFDTFGGGGENGDDAEELRATDETSDVYAEDDGLEYIEVPKSLLDKMNGETSEVSEPEATDTGKNGKKKRKKKTRDALKPADVVKSAEAEMPTEAETPSDAVEKKGSGKGKRKKRDKAPETETDEEKKTESDSGKKKPEKSNDDIDPEAGRTDTESDAAVKPASSARLVIVLTIICAAVALLLSVVNHFTEARIAENTRKAMLRSIQTIFDGGVQAEELRLPEGSGISAAYLVMKGGNVCGYSALAEPTGFGGAISLMVGVDHSGAVVGVRIISMSETPGLGSRVGGDEFLSSFNGKSGEISVDVISGASISSAAVISGVNSVTSSLLDLEALAAERGMSVAPYVRTEDIPETSAPSEESITVQPPVTELPETVVPTDTGAEPVIPEITKGDAPAQIIVENPNKESSGITVEYTYDTAEYETLTTEPETDTE